MSSRSTIFWKKFLMVCYFPGDCFACRQSDNAANGARQPAKLQYVIGQAPYPNAQCQRQHKQAKAHTDTDTYSNSQCLQILPRRRHKDAHVYTYNRSVI